MDILWIVQSLNLILFCVNNTIVDSVTLYRNVFNAEINAFFQIVT